jgi:hypothetical protein
MALTETQSHEQVLAIGLPGIDMGKNNLQEFARKKECEPKPDVDSQFAFRQGEWRWPHIPGVEVGGSARFCRKKPSKV